MLIPKVSWGLGPSYSHISVLTLFALMDLYTLNLLDYFFFFNYSKNVSNEYTYVIASR